MLELASLPKRRRLQETLEYEEQTAEALAMVRRDMSYRLEKLESTALRPIAMQSGGN